MSKKGNPNPATNQNSDCRRITLIEAIIILIAKEPAPEEQHLNEKEFASFRTLAEYHHVNS